MKFAKISKEEAERLAQRDRNRLIGMTVLAVLLAAAYLFTRTGAESKRDAENANLAGEMADDRPTDQALQDIYVPPFGDEAILAEIKDSTPAEQEQLQPEPLAAVFGYARTVSQKEILRAMGQTDLDADLQAKIETAPGQLRMAPLRVRGVVAAAQRRARPNSSEQDWIGTLTTLDGRDVHFLVARAPLRSNQIRAIARGDFLRLDGLFYGLHSRPVERDGGFTIVTAPLIVARDLVPTPAPMTEEIARETPALENVVDDTISDVSPMEDFDDALWQLMGKAELLDGEVDWAAAPELDSELLDRMFENGSDMRGTPVRIPVSVNLDTFSYTVTDNPLRLERITEGWIGNMTWKGNAKALRWFGPFVRRDMVREQLNEEHRYVTARGFFFRNHVYNNSKGQIARAPVFVLSDIEVYTIPADPNVALFKRIILGGTILVIGMIVLLLIADKRRSQKLYEDMLRRKRERRARQASSTEEAAGTA